MPKPASPPTKYAERVAAVLKEFGSDPFREGMKLLMSATTPTGMKIELVRVLSPYTMPKLSHLDLTTAGEKLESAKFTRIDLVQALVNAPPAEIEAARQFLLAPRAEAEDV